MRYCPFYMFLLFLITAINMVFKDKKIYICGYVYHQQYFTWFWQNKTNYICHNNLTTNMGIYTNRLWLINTRSPWKAESHLSAHCHKAVLNVGTQQMQGDNSSLETKFPNFSLTIPWPNFIFSWPKWHFWTVTTFHFNPKVSVCSNSFGMQRNQRSSRYISNLCKALQQYTLG